MHVSATPAAVDAVRRVRDSGRTDLVIVLSNGCCSSTAPYLFDRYLPEPGSVDAGDVDGVRVLVPAWIARMYADDEHLRIDAAPQPADDSMSLETDLGLRLALTLP